MAWWDHEELKSPDHRSRRYVLAFPNEYNDSFVRKTALEVLQHPEHYAHLQKLAASMLNYGLPDGMKPRFRIKYKKI